MITNVSLVTVYVNDIDEAKAFYTEKLGFVLKNDVSLPDFRWCTVYQADHPELELQLALPGPPLDEEATAAIKRMMAKGTMHGFGIATDEPSDRPYGVEAVLRDNSGNWLVLVEQRPYTAEDFN